MSDFSARSFGSRLFGTAYVLADGVRSDVFNVRPQVAGGGWRCQRGITVGPGFFLCVEK